MRKKCLRSLLSVLLTGLILCEMIPLQCFAVNTPSETSVAETQAADPISESLSADSVILGEITSERDEYEKRFQMSDGTIQAVQYDIPVHYQDTTGQWIDYDKTLTETDALAEESDPLFCAETAGPEQSQEEKISPPPTASDETSSDDFEDINSDESLEQETSDDASQGLDEATDSEKKPNEETEEVESENIQSDNTGIIDEGEEGGEGGDTKALPEATVNSEENGLNGENRDEAVDVPDENTAISTENVPEGTEESSNVNDASDEDLSFSEEDTLTEPATDEVKSSMPQNDTSTNTTQNEIAIKEWINISPDFTVRFSKKTNGNKFVRVEIDGHALAWSYNDANKVGTGESSFNLLENADLSNGTSNWTMTDGEIAYDAGTRSYINGIRLKGSTTAQNKASQNIAVSGNAGDVFSFGSWVYAISAPTNGNHHGDDPNPVYRLALTYYNNGTQVGQDIVEANSEVPHYQFISGESIAPAAYTNIAFEFIYDYNINYGYYCGGYCYKEQYGQTYTYDDNGNIISAVDLAESESQFQYSGNLMSKLINPSGSSYEYTYNETTKLLTSATSSDGQTYAFTYDDKGNVLSSTISASGSSQTINASATYSADKNFMSSLTEQSGNTTSYTFDGARGTLLTSTDAAGNTTTYTYEPNNNQLTSVSAGGQTNNYTYANDRLSSISVGGDIQYNYTYDAYGRPSTISAGDVLLRSYSYDTNNLLSSITLDDTTSIEYLYDSLDRPILSMYVNTAGSWVFESYKKEYFYGSNGELATTLDFTANTHTRYVYDLAGRLVSQREYDTTDLSGNTLLNSTDYTFADTTNYLTGVTHYSQLGTQMIGYRYGNVSAGEMPDQVYDVTWNGTTLQSNVYDAFGRLSNRVIRPSTSVALNNQYTYLDGATSGTTTTLVGSLTNKLGTYTYTYDSLGNIASISDGTNTTSYQYDALNQLVRENNQEEGYTYTYTYDHGNIKTRTKYAYTTGAVGTALGTQTWTYDDSGLHLLTDWQDYSTEAGGSGASYSYSFLEPGKLFTVNDHESDDWYEAEYQWTGDRLWAIMQASPSDDGGTFAVESAFEYDGDGRRIEKDIVYRTINADYTDFNETYVDTEYFYSGDILAGQKDETNTLVFLYDNNGEYFGFTYNGTPYYYVKNLQGDVIGITDASGTVVVQYAYDAWGKLLEVSGSLASTVGEANPLRYRSYYYDSETGLYYLNNRYYDPERCMFISTDTTDTLTASPTELTNKNLFAYCNNNPIAAKDQDGQFAVSVIVGSALLGGLIGGISGAVSAAISGESVLAGAVTGAASGALLTMTSIIPIPGLQIAAAGLISAASDVANQYWNYKIDQGAMDQENSGAFLDELDWASVAVSAAAGIISSRMDIRVNRLIDDSFKDAPNTITTGVARTIATTNITTSRTILQIIVPKMILPNSNPRTRQQMVPMLY